MRYRKLYSYFLVGLILIVHLPLKIVCSELDTLEILSFNPLHIGDRWQYHRYNVNIDDTITVCIIGDTVLWNNQRYYIKEITKFPGSRYFIRIDTLSLKMLIYHEYDSTEVTLFNYIMPDTGKQCYADTVTGITYCEWFYQNQEVGDIPLYTDEIGNSISTPGEYNIYCYSKGIGHSYYEWFFKHTGGYETLIAVEIQGVVYGEFVEIESRPTNESDFYLFQNYPNPFNTNTAIKFRINQISNVSLSIYDINGHFIEKLFEKNMSPGNYQYLWDARKYSSGIYFYKLITDNRVFTRKCILVK